MNSIIAVWLKFKTSFQAAAGWVARSATFGNVIALSWVIIFIVIGVLVVEELARDVVTIEPISVPKTLADDGYTPEVASRRFARCHHALRQHQPGGALMEQLNITPSDELPDFIVPKVDLSINALVGRRSAACCITAPGAGYPVNSFCMTSWRCICALMA